MLYFKALLTVDAVVLRIAPEFDYKKEVRRASRLVRMRELDKMYRPGALIDRALSLQLLAGALPDFLVARLQDFEQGQKTIYRRLHLLPLVAGNALRSVAWLTVLVFAALAAERASRRLGWLEGAAALSHPRVRAVIDAAAPTLVWGLPVAALLLFWAARSVLSRTYKKVQKDD
jgi:hypothetical protein